MNKKPIIQLCAENAGVRPAEAALLNVGRNGAPCKRYDTKCEYKHSFFTLH